METFNGFESPEQNWCKFPNNWTDITSQMTSLAEMKIVEYVLRHTWGFHEFQTAKRISIDEFINGRKKKDGGRMDSGTGLSNPSVIDGLRRAEEHGLLVVKINEKDLSRITKSYCLRMKNTPLKKVNVRSKESIEGLLSKLVVDPKNVSIEHRKTPKKDNKEEHAAASPPLSDTFFDSSNGSTNGKSHKESFELRGARYLYEKLIETGAGRNVKKSKLSSWTKSFQDFLENENAPSKKEFKSLLTWYCDQLPGIRQKEFMPLAFSAHTFCEKYDGIEAACLRDKPTEIEGRIVEDGIVYSSFEENLEESKKAQEENERMKREDPEMYAIIHESDLDDGE